jgi:hypothetical protein
VQCSAQTKLKAVPKVEGQLLANGPFRPDGGAVAITRHPHSAAILSGSETKRHCIYWKGQGKARARLLSAQDMLHLAAKCDYKHNNILSQLLF